MELTDILRIALGKGASDVHLRAGSPPMIRIQGELTAVSECEPLSPVDTAKIAASILSKSHKERFSKTLEIDLAYSVSGLGRFRVNVFRQRSTLGLVFRTIATKVPDFASLNLPPVLEQITEERRGLILVTGTTGSGKSTTLAAMIDRINSLRSGHILTIEDPIEFLHRDKRCIVTQREVGSDTGTYASALRSALRQDPDVILVGEMRDLETVEIALAAAETGHLVLSTVHTINATETIARVVSLFPPHHQDGIRIQLGGILKAIISQRLVPRADGQGRIPAVEVLVNAGRIREYIEKKERSREIPDALARGFATEGTQTFDQSLYQSYTAGLITYDDALRFATNADDLALRLSGVVSTDDSY